jgi:transcriptional regulator with XRE-family HTH domain
MPFQEALRRSGRNLQRIRYEKRMTTAALAALSEVEEEAITRFEAGNGGDVAIADLLKMAEVLDVYIRDILSDTGI